MTYVSEFKYLDATTAEIKFLTKLEDCHRKYMLLKHWKDQGICEQLTLQTSYNLLAPSNTHFPIKIVHFTCV